MSGLHFDWYHLRSATSTLTHETGWGGGRIWAGHNLTLKFRRNFVFRCFWEVVGGLSIGANPDSITIPQLP